MGGVCFGQCPFPSNCTVLRFPSQKCINLVFFHLGILSLRVTFPLLFPGTALPTPFSNLAADVILKKEQCKPYWSQPPGLHTSKFRWELFGGGPGNPLLIYKKKYGTEGAGNFLTLNFELNFEVFERGKTLNFELNFELVHIELNWSALN